MTYASLLSEESIESQYLVIMRPRRTITESWTLVSGNIYFCSFDFGIVTEVSSEGEILAQHTSSSVGLNQWYFDENTFRLYVNIGANPTTAQIVATFEIYMGTFDAHFNRNPVDSLSTVVYYEPLISRSPQVVTSASDVLFGFLPTFSSSISVSNVTNFLQKYLYDCSFNRAEVDVYHWLDSLETANVKLILTGYCQSYKVADVSVEFSILDSTSYFDTQWRNPLGPSFYGTTAFPNLDPNYSARPVRQVFGFVDGFVPVNVDYNTVAPTTSNNRTWVCIADETNVGSVSTTVLASPASTTTRTYLTSANGFRVGDSFWNETQNRSEYVTAVNKTGSHYIEHAALAGAAVTANVVRRSFVGGVSLVKDSIVYKLKYGTHYSEYLDATNKVAGFTLANNFEAALSPAISTLLPTDKIFCRVYGHKNTTTIAASPFGSDSAETGCLTDPYVILWYALTVALGLPEADMDSAGFISLEGTSTTEIGFSIPFQATSETITYKEIISRVCQSLLAKFFLNDDLNWTMREIGPIGSATKLIEDDEILEGSFSYDISYQDIISLALVEYNFREVGDDASSGLPLIASYENVATKNLHLIERQKTFQSLFFKAVDAEKLAKRLAFALGDRSGLVSFRTKNRFFDTLLNDVVQVSRDQMIGFAYDADTLNSRSLSVIETNKSLTEISISLSDQKGIEDNEGDW